MKREMLFAMLALSLIWGCRPAAVVEDPRLTEYENRLAEALQKVREGENKLAALGDSLDVLKEIIKQRDAQIEEHAREVSNWRTHIAMLADSLEKARARAVHARTLAAQNQTLTRELASIKEAKVPGSFELIQRIITHLPFAEIEFTTPRDLLVGDTGPARLQLSTEPTIQELRSRLADATADAEITVEFDPAQFSASLTPHLSGTPGLAVRTLERAGVRGTSPAKHEWKWDVQAVDVGAHNLELTLSAVLTVNGKSVPVILHTATSNVDVTTSIWRSVDRFVSSNWEWLWIVGAGVFVIIVLVARRGRPEEK